jgi:NAD(P)H-hydrate epimerase
MRVLTADQMRRAEHRAIADIGIPAIVLMENAGRQVVAAMESTFESLTDATVAILCGRGNNGGDGFVVARTLIERGIDTRVYLIGQAADVRGEAAVNLRVLRNLSVDVVEVGDAGAWELHAPAVLDADIIVDALLGTGGRPPVEGLLETIVADVNASDGAVVAVDLPTGLDASVERVEGPAIQATLTVTLAAPKIAHVQPPAEQLVGQLVIADIGIPAVAIDAVDGPWVDLLTPDLLRPHVAPRPADSQKGDFGRVLVVAGSRGMTGAAWLAATAALRSGAGLVTLAVPASLQSTVAAMGAEYMTLGLTEGEDGTVSAHAADSVLAHDADVIVIGPGLGRSLSTQQFVRTVVSGATVPVVLDADALYAYATDHDDLHGRDDAPVIVTPHLGEMARLINSTIDDVQARRVEVARELATTRQLHVVLKGHRTLVALPDGRVSVNLTGNPGMATGGTGDVLAGMLGAWVGQLMDPSAATQLAVYLHGAAGDLATEAHGEVSVIAGDLIDHIGDALRTLQGARKAKT